jgi:hypothetical protein
MQLFLDAQREAAPQFITAFSKPVVSIRHVIFLSVKDVDFSASVFKSPTGICVVVYSRHCIPDGL